MKESPLTKYRVIFSGGREVFARAETPHDALELAITWLSNKGEAPGELVKIIDDVSDMDVTLCSE